MNYSTIENALADVNGASFVGIDTKVNVALKGGKKNPMQGCVTKVMTGAQVMVFQNKNINGYEAMVQRRLVAEGKDPASFELGQRAWGTRIPNKPFVEHNGKYYLEVIFLRAGAVQYFLNDAPIDRKDIVGLEDKDEGKQGGLDNKVIIRTFAIENVTEIRIDRKAFN